MSEVVDSGLNGSDLVELQAENAVGGLGDTSLPRNGSMLSCKIKSNQILRILKQRRR